MRVGRHIGGSIGGVRNRRVGERAVVAAVGVTVVPGRNVGERAAVAGVHSLAVAAAAGRERDGDDQSG